MQKAIIIIVVLLILVVGFYYFNSKNNANVPPVDNSQITPASVTVSMKNIAFNPANITIKTGTKVVWINNDTMAHTVTSDSDNLLNSPVLSPGQSFSFIFTSPGSFNYHCSIHPSTMKGSVLVEN